jgi:AraC-like DNA-binding protein
LYYCLQIIMRSIAKKARQLNISLSETVPMEIHSRMFARCRESLYDMHFGLEMGIILSGMIRRDYIGGYSRLCKAGQAWFCGMWEPHGFEVVKAPCEMIVAIIWPPLLAQMRFEEAPELKWMAPFVADPSVRPQVAPAKKKECLEQARLLKKLAALSSPVEKARARLCLINILTMFLTPAPQVNEAGVGLRPEQWSKLNRVVQLVMDNHAFVSTTRAAKECGLNRNVFSQLFEKWMGLRFADFALRFRLKSAAGQLLNGNDPIKALARQWGFVDDSHFIRQFWKYYNCSPSEFRRRHKQ